MSQDDNTTNPIKLLPVYPADCDQTWRVPNSPKLANTSHDYWYGLTLNGTTSADRIRVEPRFVLPQTPAKIAGALTPPCLEFGAGFTNFQGLISYLASAVSDQLRHIVGSYAALAAFYSSKTKQWQEDGYVRPSADSYFYEKFQHCEVFETGKTVREVVGTLFHAVRSLKESIKFPDSQVLTWEEFPTEWPPRPVDGEFKLVSTPMDIQIACPAGTQGIEVTNIKQVVVTVNLIMDTQGYGIPRGFTLDVRGVEYYVVVETDHDPSSSCSSSSAYGGGDDPSGG